MGWHGKKTSFDRLAGGRPVRSQVHPIRDGLHHEYALQSQVA